MAILAATSVVALVVSRSDTNVHPDGVGLSAETAARGRAGGAVTTAKAAKGGSDDKGATTTAVDTSTPPATSPRSFPVGASGNPELIPVLLAPPLPGFTPSADGFAQLAEPALDPTNLPAGATHTVVRAWVQGEVILSETAFDSANPFDAAARLDTLVQAFRTRSGAASVPLPNGLNGSVTSLPRGSGTLTVVAVRHVSRDFVILIASPGPGPDPATIIGLAQAQDAAS